MEKILVQANPMRFNLLRWIAFAPAKGPMPIKTRKVSVKPEIKYRPKSKRERPNSKRDIRKFDKAIFSKPQNTINSRQHSQFSQDVCCLHHRRSCAFSELFKLTSPKARSRVSANIKIVKKVVQWTSFVILLIVTASFCLGLMPSDKR